MSLAFLLWFNHLVARSKDHEVLPTLLAIGLLAVATPAFSASPIPVEVESVVSGGNWEGPGERYGTYRIIVSTTGFDHLTSSLTVQWIESPHEGGPAARVVAEVQVFGFGEGGGRLEPPVLSLVDHRWILQADATNTYCEKAGATQHRFALGKPGEVLRISPSADSVLCEQLLRMHQPKSN